MLFRAHGSLFAGNFGFRLGFRGAVLVTTLCVARSLFLSRLAFNEEALCAHKPMWQWSSSVINAQAAQSSLFDPGSVKVPRPDDIFRGT